MTRPAALLLALAAAIPAADTIVSDLRIGLGVASVPDHRSGSWTNVSQPDPPYIALGAPISDSYEQTVGTAFSLSATFGRLSPFGFLYGGQLRYVGAEMTFKSMDLNGYGVTDDSLEASTGNTVPGVTYSQAGAAVHAGLGWTPRPGLHLELLALAGYDWLTFDGLSNIGTTVDTAEGRGQGKTLGVQLGSYWAIDDHWQFGVLAEFIRSESEIVVNYIEGEVTYQVDDEGLGARAVLGYRF